MESKFIIGNKRTGSLIKIIFFLLICSRVSGQQTEIIIETSSNAMVLATNEKGELSTSYFGKKLANKTEYLKIALQYKQGQEYTGVAGAAYTALPARHTQAQVRKICWNQQ